MKMKNGADKTCAISWPKFRSEKGFSTASTWKLSRRQKAQLFDGRLERFVRRH
jgi:hypothetical protein